MKKLRWLLLIPLLYIVFLYLVFSFYNSTFEIKHWEMVVRQTDSILTGVPIVLYYVVMGTNWSDIMKLG